MLIIFDLDDTLIQTTRQITPFKLKSLYKVFQQNLALKNQTIDFSMLQRINLGAGGSSQAIIEFAQVLGLSDSTIKNILYDFTVQIDLPDVVDCTIGANESLKELSLEHTLMIVTRGNFPFQKKKINQANLLLEKIKKWKCVEKGSKLGAYYDLQQEEGVSSEEVVVIGDRVDLDLIPAKKLGFHTILVPSNRSMGNFLEKEEIVDYQICSLNELSGMIQDIKLKNFLRKI